MSPAEADALVDGIYLRKKALSDAKTAAFLANRRLAMLSAGEDPDEKVDRVRGVAGRGGAKKSKAVIRTVLRQNGFRC